MTVAIYKSTDASAPSLTGVAGSMITLLDAVLVNGYGSQSAAGWTKTYSGTNKAVYRSSGGQYYRIDDAGSTAAGGSAKTFGMRGYGAMSDVDTGTDPFPTSAVATNGLFGLKSSTTDATARPWMIVADAYTCYLFVDSGYVASAGYTPFVFGDIYSFKSGDAWKGFIAGRYPTSSWTSTINDYGGNFGACYGQVVSNGAGSTADPGYMPRAYSQTGSAIQVNKFVEGGILTGALSAIIAMGTVGVTYPHPVDGGLYMSPLFINESGAFKRGYLRGLWVPLHNRPLTPQYTGQAGDTFSGTGALAGKTFLAVKIANIATPDCQIFIETSDTWGVSS